MLCAPLALCPSKDMGIKFGCVTPLTITLGYNNLIFKMSAKYAYHL
jgi:hypothetical protein